MLPPLAEPYFCDYVLEYAPEVAADGGARQDRRGALKTINQRRPDHPDDPRRRIQKAAQKDDHQDGADRQQAASAPRRPSSSPAPARSSRWPRTRTSATARRRKTNFNVDRPAYGGGAASSSGRRPRRSRLVDRAGEGHAAQRHDQGAFADGKQPSASRKRLSPSTVRRQKFPVNDDYASGGKLMTLLDGTAESVNTGFANLAHRARRRATSRHDDQAGPAPGRRQADRPLRPGRSPSASGTTHLR